MQSGDLTSTTPNPHVPCEWHCSWCLDSHHLSVPLLLAPTCGPTVSVSLCCWPKHVVPLFLWGFAVTGFVWIHHSRSNRSTGLDSIMSAEAFSAHHTHSHLIMSSVTVMNNWWNRNVSWCLVVFCVKKNLCVCMCVCMCELVLACTYF